MNSTLKSYLTQGDPQGIAGGRRRRGQDTRLRRRAAASGARALHHAPRPKRSSSAIPTSSSARRSGRRLVVEQGSIFDFLMVIFQQLRQCAAAWSMIAIGALATLHPPLPADEHARPGAQEHPFPLRPRRPALFALPRRRPAIFLRLFREDGVTSLDEAQLAKKRHLAAKLALRAGPARARHRLGLGRARPLSRRALRRRGHRRDAVGGAARGRQPRAPRSSASRTRPGSCCRTTARSTGRSTASSRSACSSMSASATSAPSSEACREPAAPTTASMVLHSIGRSDGPGDTSAWIQQLHLPRRLYPGASPRSSRRSRRRGSTSPTSRSCGCTTPRRCRRGASASSPIATRSWRSTTSASAACGSSISPPREAAFRDRT